MITDDKDSLWPNYSGSTEPSFQLWLGNGSRPAGFSFFSFCKNSVKPFFREFPTLDIWANFLSSAFDVSWPTFSKNPINKNSLYLMFTLSDFLSTISPLPAPTCSLAMYSFPCCFRTEFNLSSAIVFAPNMIVWNKVFLYCFKKCQNNFFFFNNGKTKNGIESAKLKTLVLFLKLLYLNI